MANLPLLSTLISAFQKLLRGERIEAIEIGGTKHQLTLDIMSKNSLNALSIINPFTVFDLENMLERTTKKPDNHAGSVFTPSHIADAMVEYALDTWILGQLKYYKGIEAPPTKIGSLHTVLLEIASINPQKCRRLTHDILTSILPTMTLLDPCVGGGVFIRAITRRLVWYNLVLGPLWLKPISLEITHISDELEQISPEAQLDICINVTTTLAHQLYFVDINPHALEVAMITIKTLLFALFPSTPRFFSLIRDIKSHTLHQNAITSPLETFPPHFHIIIGNPPYIGSDMMNRIFPLDVRQRLKQSYKHVIKTGSKHDYFFYFVAKCISLLSPDGLLLFILPNRILSNDYAQLLRSYILQKTKLTLVANFSPSLNIFPEANVHPCILGLTRHSTQPPELKGKGKNIEKKKGKEEKKEEEQEKETYWGGDITISPDMKVLSLFHPQFHLNSLDIAQKFGIFFPSISPEMNHILRIITSYHPLTDFLTIHEGTRMARVIPQIPPTMSAQISSSEYLSLTSPQQQMYVGEIRGKNITRYAIDDTLPAISYFLALPELLPEKSGLERTEKLTQLSRPTVFIRELGDRMFAGLHINPKYPIIGYGGVYFFGVADFHPNKLVTPPSIHTLYAFLVYLSSTLFLKIYHTLFSAGKWGSALKFRSSYLERMPVIPFDQELFGHIGEMLSWLHKKKLFSTSLESIRIEVVRSLEKMVDYHLEDILNGPVDEELKEQFNPIYIKWKLLKQERKSEEAQLKRLHYLQNSLQTQIHSLKAISPTFK